MRTVLCYPTPCNAADEHIDHASSNEPLHRALQRRSVTSHVISTTALWEQESEEQAGAEADAKPLAPVRDVEILTDGTLLANALEAGDVMHIRNMAVFMDRRRMVGSIASTLACASGGNGLQQLVGKHPH